MGRMQIDPSIVQRNVKLMLKHIQDYELIKKNQHPRYHTVTQFYKENGLARQNFIKYYHRFQQQGRDPSALLPVTRGRKPKYKDSIHCPSYLEQKIIELRKEGFNRYSIHRLLREDPHIPKEKMVSPITIYRIAARHGLGGLKGKEKPNVERYHKAEPGDLGHADLHYLSKFSIANSKGQRYYILGVIDDHTRICWLEVVESAKAIDVSFAMLDILLALHMRYGIQFRGMLTDNGPEFTSNKGNKENHLFERLMKHFGIKSSHTRPYTPQTNGKIERFWKTLEEELLEEVIFDSVEALREELLKYLLYYNEHRPHQGIDGLTPLEKLHQYGTENNNKEKITNAK